MAGFERLQQALVERAVVPVVAALGLGHAVEQRDQRGVDVSPVSSAGGTGQDDESHPVGALRRRVADRTDVRVGHTPASGTEGLNGSVRAVPTAQSGAEVRAQPPSSVLRPPLETVR